MYLMQRKNSICQQRKNSICQNFTKELFFLPVHPDKCTIVLAALSDPDLDINHVTYWDDVYGFKMTCMKSEVIKEASVETVKAEKILSDCVVVKVRKASLL